MLYMEHAKLPRAVTEVVQDSLEQTEISHREVIRRTGIGSTTFGRRMTGNSPFNIDELALVAGVLNLRPSELIRKAEDLLLDSSDS